MSLGMPPDQGDSHKTAKISRFRVNSELLKMPYAKPASSRSRRSLLQLRKPCLHVLQVLVDLHVLGAVAELGLQAVLVGIDLASELVQLLLLLGAQGGLAALLALLLLGILRAARLLLLLELVHPLHPLHYLRVLVLLAAAHALGLQLRLAVDDVLLQLVELLLLRGAQAGALHGLLGFLLLLLRLLLGRGGWGLGRRGLGLHGPLDHVGTSLHEESVLRLQTLHDLARIDVLGFHLQVRDLLALGRPLLLVVLARELSHLRVQGRDLRVDLRLVLLGAWHVELHGPILGFEELQAGGGHLLHDRGAPDLRHLVDQGKI
mmetsp:Transcript_98403/g.254439  ORF Transcript_98403/g.254439 Transcript_98403/m.254439 type:complete len:319 (+) Transcript_98403:100-1056(+)